MNPDFGCLVIGPALYLRVLRWLRLRLIRRDTDAVDRCDVTTFVASGLLRRRDFQAFASLDRFIYKQGHKKYFLFIKWSRLAADNVTCVFLCVFVFFRSFSFQAISVTKAVFLCLLL